MYPDFLQNELPRLYQNIPLATRNAMWLQHDEARAHYSMQVRNHLNQDIVGLEEEDQLSGRHGHLT